MAMYDNVNDILKVFRFDEDMLRLLYYPPQDIVKNIPDPLDPSLSNILEFEEEELWALRDERIYNVEKSSDLEGNPICRIYVYAGRRIPNNSNYLLSAQQLIVDILCHYDFEKDLRSLRISDRINELLVAERITGIGKTEYVDGYKIGSPLNYAGYRHIYKFGSSTIS